MADATRPGAANPDISLVICTYNRAGILERALQSACRQAVHPSRSEILVVDNNSADHTREIVAGFQRDHANLRYLHETRIGLSHARNRGWQEARAPYVAYVDDDCILPPHWLAVALEIIAVHRPQAFGGPYRAFYLSPRPAWYKDSYASGNHGPIARNLGEREYLFGGNMTYRCSMLDQLGGFDPHFGMAGANVGYGEDTEIQIRLSDLYPETGIWYDPRLEVLHLVRPDKMTLPWMARAAIAKGRYQYWTSAAPGPPTRTALCIEWIKLAKTLSVVAYESVDGLVRRDEQKYPYCQNYLRERVLWRLSRIGNVQAQHAHYRNAAGHRPQASTATASDSHRP